MAWYGSWRWNDVEIEWSSLAHCRSWRTKYGWCKVEWLSVIWYRSWGTEYSWCRLRPSRINGLSTYFILNAHGLLGSKRILSSFCDNYILTRSLEEREFDGVFMISYFCRWVKQIRELFTLIMSKKENEIYGLLQFLKIMSPILFL